MKKYYTAVAKDNYELGPHTWTKDLDYQLVEKNERLILASDQGDTGYEISKKDELKELFQITDGWNPY